jgi:hypothetical protein
MATLLLQQQQQIPVLLKRLHRRVIPPSFHHHHDHRAVVINQPITIRFQRQQIGMAVVALLVPNPTAAMYNNNNLSWMRQRPVQEGGCRNNIIELWWVDKLLSFPFSKKVSRTTNNNEQQQRQNHDGC